MIRKFFLLVTALLAGLTATARERQNFDKDWRFMLADSVQMAQAEYDDSSWRQLDVPHDWAIEGDFYAIPVVRVGERSLAAPAGIVSTSRSTRWRRCL